jgi:nucleoside-diphosphate-sugar epimerase
VGNIGGHTDWTDAMTGVDIVVHLAARVHVMREDASDPLEAFREVNYLGTERLAEQAAEQGIKRFVYVSSIKVNGERTEGRPFTADDTPAPTDPYALSKFEAEQRLHEIGRSRGMEVVVIRPPLVYGPGVKGNFVRLMSWIDKGIPLPLDSVSNARSMISVDNLTDFLLRCLDHPKAAGQTFLVSDGAEWSTPELIRTIARHMGVKVRLFPLPIAVLDLLGRLTGSTSAVRRLCDSLEVDISKARVLLEWEPVQSPDAAIGETAKWYIRQK